MVCRFRPQTSHLEPIQTERRMMARLSDIRNLLMDMDGVLYRGQTGLAGAPELSFSCENTASAIWQ